MPAYKGQQLVRFKEKTGGKNNSEVDGFYKNEKGDQFFIKRPADKKELFAELFAGLILQEFMDRGLIDPIYFPSLIVADWIRFEDGSYGLIQPMVSFTELHKIIGTSTTDGKDRNETKEAFSGPQHYPTLMQKQYFGLSISLLFSLLLGAHSVHSGNVVALNNKQVLSTQYGRLDWGDAFRYFGHPQNNENLLYAYENRGWLNYKQLTKDYFLNYKLIVGLFPSMASKGLLLKEQIEKAGKDTLVNIVDSALNRIPADLIDSHTQAEFATYAHLPTFKDIALGDPQSDKSRFTIPFANILAERLEKITHLQDLTERAQEQSVYESTIIVAPPILVMSDGSFDESIKNWQALLKKSIGAQNVNLEKVDLSQLATQFNEYLDRMAQTAEHLNIWEHGEENSNIFATFNTEKEGKILHGHAFIGQYKESVVFRNLFSLDPKTLGTRRFAPYEQPTELYAKKFPESPWAKLQQLANASHDVIQTLRLIQTAQTFGFENAIDIPALQKHTERFLQLKEEIDLLFAQKNAVHAESEGSPYFYTIGAQDLQQMSGEQLATLCFEELNQHQPSLTVLSILKDEGLWKKLNIALDNPSFLPRLDEPKAKIMQLRQWRQLIELENRQQAKELESLKQQEHQLELATKELLQLQSQAAGLQKALKEKQEQLELTQEQKNLLQKTLSGLEQQAKEERVSNDELNIIKEKAVSQAQRLDELTKELEELRKHNAELEQIKKIMDESQLGSQKAQKAPPGVARVLLITPILTQLEVLKKKAAELDSRKEEKAYKAAHLLINDMETEIEKYLHSSEEGNAAALTALQHATLPKIATAAEELREHRKKWKCVLANLTLAVLLAGVGYLVAMGINKGVNGRYTFFSETHSKACLINLEKAITEVNTPVIAV